MSCADEIFGRDKVSAEGKRSAKVIANAFRAGFHRSVYLVLPVPVGSRERVTR